jgi:hypothetical protein
VAQAVRVLRAATEKGVSIRRTPAQGYLAMNPDAIGKGNGIVFSIVSVAPAT